MKKLNRVMKNNAKNEFNFRMLKIINQLGLININLNLINKFISTSKFKEKQKKINIKLNCIVIHLTVHICIFPYYESQNRM